MTPQACPNCHKTHDVSVFVTGQRILCTCGIKFEVKRNVSGEARASGERRAGSIHPTTPARPGKQSATSVEPDLNAGTPVDDSSATFIAGAPDRPDLPGIELVEILGRGGMGEVWRAKQLSLSREVAVKLLPPKLAKDPEFVARFEKEATALAALSHPNIIQIIDRGMAGDHYYFVMELVNGRSLREFMNKGPLKPEDALKVVVQICQAIDYAHDQQIIHRDLKPENILIDGRGNVKVADFGLAGMKGPESGHHLTATAVAMGTINYMAPEQRRDAKHVDGRADLFSLGVILYELLTSELPVGRFKLPGERIPGLDSRVDPIVAKALESDPQARYQRASEVIRDVQALIGTSAVLPAFSGVSTTPARPSGEHPRASTSALKRAGYGLRVGLSIIGALAVIGTTVRLLWRPSHDDQVAIRLPNGSQVVVETRHAPPSTTSTAKLPPNTEDQLYSSIEQKDLPGGLTRLFLSFDGGDEQLNCHAGQWTLHDGKLWATQAGNVVAGKHLKLVPRAYLAHRYFSSDDFVAESDVILKALEPDLPVDPGEPRFAELAFRIKDMQVSLFALPGKGMRLAWHYFTPDGTEVEEDSSQEVGKLMADEVELPPDGQAFHLKLSLQKKKGGTEVQAFANDQRFIRKLLPGFEGQVGKVAVGCRNLHCTFDQLTVTGLTRPRPAGEKAEADAR